MKYALSPCDVAVPPSKPVINEARLRIPEDISIINGCDSDLAEFAIPPITVIRKDFAGVGTVAGATPAGAAGRGAAQEKQAPPSHFAHRTHCSPILRRPCGSGGEKSRNPPHSRSPPVIQPGPSFSITSDSDHGCFSEKIVETIH